MKKIKIFLASSNELHSEREYFERKIYRKCKDWIDRGIFLHLDIWEDLSTRISTTGSQSEYNKSVQTADLFVLLAHTKVGMYTEEEFDLAWALFQKTGYPRILTYFKKDGFDPLSVQDSLGKFYSKLTKDLQHFPDTYEGYAHLEGKIWREIEQFVCI